jgi:hypothetical protein
MRSLKLDFLHPSPGTGWPAWLLLFAGLALAGWAGWHDTRLDRKIAAESAELRRQSISPRSARTGMTSAGISQADTQLAGEQLSLPWSKLFSGLEKVKPRNIALIALEADGRKTEATLTAEARDFNDMLAYVEALKNEAGFKSVTLTSHMLREEDPEQPYRFVLRLGWRS